MNNQLLSPKGFLLFTPGVALLLYAFYLSFIYLPSEYLSAFDWRFVFFLAGYTIVSEAFLLHWREREVAKSRYLPMLGIGLITISVVVFIAPFTSIPLSGFFKQEYWISVGVAYGLAVGGTFLLRKTKLQHPLRQEKYLTVGSLLVVPPLVYLMKYSADIAFNGLWKNLGWVGYLGIAGTGCVLALTYLGSPEYYSIAFHAIAVTMAYLVWGLLGLSLIPVVFAEWYFTARYAVPSYAKPMEISSPASSRNSKPMAVPAPRGSSKSYAPTPKSTERIAVPVAAGSEPSSPIVIPGPSTIPDFGLDKKAKGRSQSLSDTGRSRNCPSCGASNPLTAAKCTKCHSPLPDNDTVIY
jgi:hypothetical protein